MKRSTRALLAATVVDVQLDEDFRVVGDEAETTSQDDERD